MERLRWEFVRLARLDHARLVRVHDLEVVEPGSAVLEVGQIFFTAEYCPGVQPAGWLERLRLLAQLDLALGQAARLLAPRQLLELSGLRLESFGQRGGLFGLATPLVLGSYWALIPQALAAVLLVVRTGLEDRMLKKELLWYTEYAKAVRFRLVPGLW